MRRLRQTIFVGVLGVFLIAFVWLVLKPHEPSYQGKTLTAWLEEAQTRDVITYPEADPAAVNAIRQMGTKSIPTLLRYVATRDSRLNQFLLKLKVKQPSLPINPRSRGETQMLAVYGFYVLGPDAKAAVPSLTALVNYGDEAVCGPAADCLGLIGPAAQSAVPDLIKEFEQEMAGTNGFYSAAFALGKIGPSARSAIPALTSGLTNRSRECCVIAQAALINVQPGTSLPAFLNQVKDASARSDWNRIGTIAALCGTNLGPAVPSLVSALNCTNDYIRFRALNALGYIHQQPEKCLPSIVSFLGSTNGLQSGAIGALRHFGKAAKLAGPALIRCLNDPDIRIRGDATNALREIDPEAAAKAGVK